MYILYTCTMMGVLGGEERAIVRRYMRERARINAEDGFFLVSLAV